MDEEKNILVSVSSEGVRGNGSSWIPSISADGRYIVFYSDSSNLVSDDTNDDGDIFVRDLVNGTTTLVSVNSEGIQENGSYYYPNISADGRFVTFQSILTESPGNDTESSGDIFVRDLVNGTTTSLSVSSRMHKMSADGRYIAYETLKPGSNISDEIFVRDLASGTTELASISSEGVKGNDSSFSPSISADGRYVTFSSIADNLVNGDTNKTNDIFVRDLVSGTTELVSISSEGVIGNSFSTSPSISADGRYVAFESGADNLVNGDTNKTGDIFVKDLVSGTTELVSISSEGVKGNSFSTSPSISADGRYVAFESNAKNLVSDDTNDTQDIFIRDLVNGNTTRVPILSKDFDEEFDGFPLFEEVDGFHLFDTTISPDGQYVAFHSYGDIFIRDLQKLGATGGVSGGDTGGSNGGDTGGNTDTDEDLHTIYEFIAKDIAYKDFQVDKIIDYGYQVNEVFEDENTGFYALGLTSTSGKSPVLAIRGTEPKIEDYFADIFSDINPEGIGFDQFTPNVETVSNWLSKQTNPDIVGHSLGGALSQYFASDFTDKGGKLGEIVTFNSPGISTEYANKFNPDNATEVNHYIASGDIVSLGGEQFIDGNYSLASFSDFNLLNKHLLPLLSEAVGYDQEEKGSKRPGNVTIKSFSSVDFLNSNFFTYTDKDYWNWILGGIAVTQSVEKLNFLQTIPPLLIFRNTVESRRKTIGNGIDLISDAITGERIASNDFIPIPKTEFNLLSLLDIQAEDLSLEYTSQPQDTFKLQGKVSIPKFYNATGDFADGNYIQINQDGIEVVGELSIKDILIVPKNEIGVIDDSKIWGIKEAKLAFDTVNNEVQGEGSILIPSGIIIGGGLGFVNNEFDFVSLEVDNLNKPIATTGLFLQRISGQVDNIAESNLNPIEFGGGIGVTGGGKIDLPLLPGWLGGKLSGSLVELDVDGTLDRNKIKADGEVRILGGLATGQTHLNFKGAGAPAAHSARRCDRQKVVGFEKLGRGGEG